MNEHGCEEMLGRFWPADMCYMTCSAEYFTAIGDDCIWCNGRFWLLGSFGARENRLLCVGIWICQLFYGYLRCAFLDLCAFPPLKFSYLADADITAWTIPMDPLGCVTRRKGPLLQHRSRTRSK